LGIGYIRDENETPIEEPYIFKKDSGENMFFLENQEFGRKNDFVEKGRAREKTDFFVK